MNRRAALRGGGVLLILVAGFVAGIYADQAYPEYMPYIGQRAVGSISLTEAQEAARLIEAQYVNSNIDTSKLSHGSVQGMVNAINAAGDPFTAYYDPAAYKRLQQSYQGKYSGIGIYLSFGTGYPVITATVPGSPAATAGLQKGDQITAVGTKDLKAITSDQATALIQGADGTKVTMTILRGTQTLTFTITRAEIQLPTVRSAMIAGHVLYIRIYQFGSQTSSEFASALTTGLAGTTGIVLDLRGNPGGFTSAADDVITQFVTSGETFETHGRGGVVDKHTVGSVHKAPTEPLVVLVDANSASASEIVSGSLQVHQRAKLVGTVTFGKGSVQQDFVLSDGADIHLTVERWFLPNGQTIDHKGLTPDLAITLATPTDEFDVTQLSAGYAKDTQLNAALGFLPPG
ncbi:MAG TPA: S41 family peptidase [Candidatus Dormibacteraeota bacterium]